jgi:hypothetical protein
MDTKRQVIALESLGTPPNNIKEGEVYTVVVEWDDYVEVDEVMGWWGSSSFETYVGEISPTIGVEKPKDPHEGIVTKPPHYTRWAIEPIEFLYRNRVEGHIFNIVKYSMRAGHKLYPGMDAVQSEIVDLKKAARNIEMRINLLEGKEVL